MSLALAKLPRTLHLDNMEAALFFVQMTSVRHLIPFMVREASLAEAARAIHISKSHMSYWLRKMLRLGVLERVRIEKRGRHNVPLYRATAEVFTVPLERVPVESDEEILTLNSRDFEKLARRSIVRSTSNNDRGWNLCFTYTDQFPQLRMLPPRGVNTEPNHLDKWGCLALTEAQARALQGEIMGLLERYTGQEPPGGKGYLYKFLLVEACLD